MGIVFLDFDQVNLAARATGLPAQLRAWDQPAGSWAKAERHLNMQIHNSMRITSTHFLFREVSDESSCRIFILSFDNISAIISM